MIKLVNVEQFDAQKFNVLVSVDGEQQSYNIEVKESTVGKGNEMIWYVVAEDDNFYNIWAHLEIRKSVSASIQTFREKSQPELQTA